MKKEEEEEIAKLALPKKLLTLLKKAGFKKSANLKKAEDEELLKIDGMDEKMVKKIRKVVTHENENRK